MDFCMHIVKHLVLEEIKNPNRKNIVLSPLSLNSVLNMIVAGTTGATLKQMLGLLGSNSIEEINKKSYEIMAVANSSGEGGPTVTSINGVWADKRYPLKASYAELLKTIYNCEANSNCDFANELDEVIKEINSWAEAASRKLIKKVIDRLEPSTRFVRTNALYFKGTWSEPFLAKNTQTKQFFLLDGTTIQVPFLTSWEKYDYGSFDGYQVLRAPYMRKQNTSFSRYFGSEFFPKQIEEPTKKIGANTSFSMYFFLPDDMSGLPNPLETFNSCWENMFLKQDLKRTDLEVVRIPKFKFSYTVDMEETMKRMGIEIPYEENQLDYAEMIEAPEELPPLKSSIIQKSFVEVDENGTTACAVTIEPCVCGSSYYRPPPRPRFVADHPFMFVIREDISGLVFFTGIILNPKESE